MSKNYFIVFVIILIGWMESVLVFAKGYTVLSTRKVFPHTKLASSQVSRPFFLASDKLAQAKQVVPSTNKSLLKEQKEVVKTKRIVSDATTKTKITKDILSSSFSQIHRSPIVLVAGKNLTSIQYYKISSYRLFRTNSKGEAEPFPFQIDEKDKYDDYILDKGKNPTTKYSNGVLDDYDEFTFMGNDVGRAIPPKVWKFRKPEIIYEVLFSNGAKKGAVYVGVYDVSRIAIPKEALSNKAYVNFNLRNAEVLTSEYRYLFNKKNYLVIRDLRVLKRNREEEKILDSSTFYLKMDFKYFLTFSINQEDIDSELDAYKVGPVRTIARVDFSYKFLGIQFDLGMYTEVSFFSNSVYLPAVIDNPIDGKKSLNKGSLFYYGLAMVESPKNLKIETNMPAHKKVNFINSFFSDTVVSENYWLTAITKEYMLYLQFRPSKQMLKSKTVPKFYLEDINAAGLKKRTVKASELGESNVNVAISFDMKDLEKEVHAVDFKFFIDNDPKKERLDELKDLDSWNISSKTIL